MMVADRKLKWFSENGPCRVCGSSDNLEVDHVNPSEKSFSIHWGMRWDALEVELKKCQALCERCHDNKSAAEKSKGGQLVREKTHGDFKHGTLNGYKYRKCRCEECRAAMNDYARKYSKTPVGRAIQKRFNSKRANPENNYRLDAPVPEKTWSFTHGTWMGYFRKKCRCEICNQWHEEWKEKRRSERVQGAPLRS